jgi:hypothetical protein
MTVQDPFERRPYERIGNVIRSIPKSKRRIVVTKITSEDNGVTCCRSFTEPLTMISTQPIETTIHNSRFQPFAYHHSNRSTRRRQHSKRIPRNEPNQGNDGLVLMIVRVSKRSLAIAANTK